jgi:hypothetical protein
MLALFSRTLKFSDVELSPAIGVEGLGENIIW